MWNVSCQLAAAVVNKLVAFECQAFYRVFRVIEHFDELLGIKDRATGVEKRRLRAIRILDVEPIEAVLQSSYA